MSILLIIVLVCISFPVLILFGALCCDIWETLEKKRASKPQYPRHIYDGIDFYGRNYACVVDIDEFLGFTAIETNDMLDMYELCVGIGQDSHAALLDMNADIQCRNDVDGVSSRISTQHLMVKA